MAFSKILTSVFLAIAYASSTSAFAIPSASKHATHTVRVIGHGLKIESFHPASSFETFGNGLDHPLAKRADGDIKGATISFMQSKLKVASNKIKFRSGLSGETAKHAYVSQVHDGIPFANAVANVAFNHDNKVMAFGSSFVKPKSVASLTPTITMMAAISTAEQVLDGKFNNHPTSLEYLVREDDSVALTHVVQIQNESVGTWYQAFIDAHSGELLSIIDFVVKASYLVLPITKEFVTQGFETLTDPQDLIASPNGWHLTGTTNMMATDGNNIVSFKRLTSSTTLQSSATLNFIYPQTASDASTTTANVNAARVNVFYIGNTVHDFAYCYSFTEVIECQHL